MNDFDFLSGPKKVLLEHVNPTSVKVTFTPPSDPPSLQQYEASVKGGSAGQKCTVKSTVMSLQCQINDLLPAKQYHVEAVGCTASPRRCSSPIEKSFWTSPNGKLNYLT